MKRKRVWLFIIIIMGSMLIYSVAYNSHKEKVITFGMFSGSQWNVPNDNCYKIVEETIEQFEEEHPGVRVEFVSGILKEDYSEWIAQNALKGKIPDVFMVLPEDFNTFSSVGILKELDDFIKNDDSFDVGEYYSGCYEAGTFNEHQYALPYECVPTFMFVNKTILRENGITIPANEWTMQDFYEICKKITKDTDQDGVIDQYGCCNYSWMDATYSLGGHLFSENGKSCNLLETEMTEAVKFYDDILYLSNNQIADSDAFDLGKVAFRPMTYAEFKTYKPYPWKMKQFFDFEWDCISMPNGEDQKGVSEVDTLLIGMNKRTKYADYAWEFLKSLTYSAKTQRKILTYTEGLSPLIQVTNSRYTQRSLEEIIGSDARIQTEMLHNVMSNAATKEKFKKYGTALEYIDGEIFKIVMDNNKDITFELQELKPRVDELLNE